MTHIEEGRVCLSLGKEEETYISNERERERQREAERERGETHDR